jgi:ABC-type cobalamin transport system permease subunit
MLNNPQEVKRLAAIEGISFSKYVKGKIDCDAAGVDIILLQAQVARLVQEIKELKTGVVTRSLGLLWRLVDKWFDD